jgi:hypothetical protein
LVIEGVDSCRKNTDIDIVTIAIETPELNGYEAIRKIWEFNKGLIVIV